MSNFQVKQGEPVVYENAVYTVTRTTNKLVYLEGVAKGVKPEELTPCTEAQLAEWAEAQIGSMNSQLKRYKPRYQKSTAASGNKSLNNGDELAKVLTSLLPLEVVELAEVVCALPTGFLATKYASLNPGQQRMNSGNRVRSALKAGKVGLELVERVAKELVAKRPAEQVA